MPVKSQFGLYFEKAIRNKRLFAPLSLLKSDFVLIPSLFEKFWVSIIDNMPSSALNRKYIRIIYRLNALLPMFSIQFP